MPEIDLYSVDKVPVGGAIPEPAARQIAEILDHDLKSVEYIRGRVADLVLKEPTNYVLVWLKDEQKFGKSHRLLDLQKKFLEGEGHVS